MRRDNARLRSNSALALVASSSHPLGARGPILPTNKRLLDPSLDKDSDLAEQLLQRWGTLHAVRSALSLASFLLFLSI